MIEILLKEENNLLENDANRRSSLLGQATKLEEARREAAVEKAARAAQAAMARRDLSRRLREARAADRAAAQLAQVKVSMAAPDWELDDHEWCASSPWTHLFPHPETGCPCRLNAAVLKQASGLAVGGLSHINSSQGILACL